MTDGTLPRATAGWIALVVVTATVLGAWAVGGPAAGEVRATALAAAPAATPGVGGSFGPAPTSHGPPSEITAGMGWAGIDYRSTCDGCLPADPVLAVGSDYVLELTNGSERVWLQNGTLVHNATLDQLFGVGNDSVVNAQVTFDLLTDRWFLVGDDLTTDQLLLGASLSSDPTAGWTFTALAPANGSTAFRPLLAVDTDDVVVTANDYAANGSFAGAQLWVANKSAMMDGSPDPAVASVGPYAGLEALVPASPLSATSTLYLVDDGVGTSDQIQLFGLSGSPPGALQLSAPTNFTTSTSLPPAAVQPESSDLLGIGDGRIESAAWRASTLWAVATGGCVPAGDNATRSCLHLWQLNTATLTLEQDFLWSSGPGTYDFDPALSLATRGDLAVVYGESSATLAPSFLATGQAVTGPVDTLVAPVPLHNGTGLYDPGTNCTNDVCPFGSAFSIAATPSTDVHFWAAGTYVPGNTTRNYWKTWVNQVAAWATLPVTFTETGLPAGTPWSVTVNGATVGATNQSIYLQETSGSYTYTVLSPITGGAGTRYLAETAAGSFVVADSGFTVEETYLDQYELTTSAGASGGGSVYPGGNWYDAGSVVTLSALADAGYVFEGWSGTGAGSYSGSANPASVTLGSPVAETASFWIAATYPVSFTETGLPAGANWTVSANGLSNSSSSPTLVFNEPNGSYTFGVSSPVPGSPQVDYFAANSSGTFSVAGRAVSLSVAYRAEYALVADVAVPNTGVVNPADGWFLAGTLVNLSALASAGELFVGWTGSGSGSYTGDQNPAPVVVDGPVLEVARFAPATTYVVTFAQMGLPVGALWSATVNGVRATSSAASIAVNLPNGTYSFGVGTSYVAANGSSYTANPAFGSFVLQGGGLHVAVTFSPVPPTATTPGTGASAASTGTIPLWVFGAVLVALLIVVGILAYATRRPPEAPPAPALPPPPPAAWDEGT